MNKILILTVAFAGVAGFTAAQAATNPALGCLQASAQNGSLAGCLNESGKGASESVAADVRSSRPVPASLSSASTETGANIPTRYVPTPTGWTPAEDGTLKAGFLKGLDSGFKTAFAGIVALAIYGIDACGGFHVKNIGTYFFTGLGILLSIPASIVGAVVGAPIGAVAGMISEKVSPGSTRGWFTF